MTITLRLRISGTKESVGRGGITDLTSMPKPRIDYLATLRVTFLKEEAIPSSARFKVWGLEFEIWDLPAIGEFGTCLPKVGLEFACQGRLGNYVSCVPSSIHLIQGQYHPFCGR